MAAETLYATSLVSGAIGTPANALGAQNGVFTTDVDNTSWTARFAMGNPVGTQANNTQSFAVRVRKEAGTGNPTVTNFVVYAGGVQVYAEATVSTITTTVGVTLTYIVPAENLAGVDLSTVEVEISAVNSGGSPSARSTVQLDSITWSGDFTTPAPPPPSTAFVGWGIPI